MSTSQPSSKKKRVSSTFVEDSFKKYLVQTNDRYIRSRLLPLLTVPLVDQRLFSRQDYLGSYVPSEPESSITIYQLSCNPKLGLTKPQRTRNMSPGNRAADIIIASLRAKRAPESLQDKYFRALLHHGQKKADQMLEAEMARLKQRDKRPKRKFQPGDIVLPHAKRGDLITVGQGIVLQELPKEIAEEIVDTELQLLLVYWAPRDVDLYTEARRFARAWVDDPGYEPDATVMKNSDLELVRAETNWLDAPSIEEMQMQRFIDVAEDLS